MLVRIKLAVVFSAVLGIALMPCGVVHGAEKSTANSVASAKAVKAAKAVPKEKASKTKVSRSAQKKPVSSASSGNKTANKAVKKVAKTRKVVAAAAPVIPERSQDVQHLAVQSGSALVVEQGGGPLYQKNANVVVPIASITKLMTAMVVLDGMPDLKASITIADEDVDYLRGSRSRLHVGTDMSRETALLLALMSSENRAAHALARHYPGGLHAFIAAMNAKAQSLGMRDTRFEDPTGLTSNNVSTAYDLAKMVSAAYAYPLIREFSTTPEASVEVAGRQQEFHNTNPLVKNAAWQVGLSKTGYIQEAGKCLVMQARVAEKPVVIVLLDSAGKLTRVGDANRIKRWMEHTHATHGVRTQASLDLADAPPG